MSARFTYNRREKLKSRKQILSLFTNGKYLYQYPVKLFYRFEDHGQGNSAVQAGVGVSKKYFKSAVKRNRTKRLLREAYRLHKHFLLENCELQHTRIYLFFLYTSKEAATLPLLETKMQHLLESLGKEYNEKSS